MAIFKLKSKERKNSKVVLLHSGETSFDVNGIAEVELRDQTALEEILASYPDITSDDVVDDPLQSQILDNNLGKSTDGDIGGNEGGNDLDEFDKVDFGKLKELASESGFDKAEWEGLNEVELRTYLKAQLAEN